MFDGWGVGVHVHAMGDGTIRVVVDALEAMKAANGDSGVRHKVAHNTMIQPEDVQRLADMTDVNIDFSPPLWYPHAGATPGLLAAVGAERADRIYPIRTALESGLSVGQGSDWLTANPVPDPFIAIESMITRSNPFDESMPGQINASEAITLEQALADMIVLNQNLFEIETNEIYGTEVEYTILNGVVVYHREQQGDIELELDDSPGALHH